MPELGYTDLGSYKFVNFKPIISESIDNRKVVLIASNNIHDTNIFLNGLSQNILLFYRLFEAMGFMCYLVQPKVSFTYEKSEYLRGYRAISPDEIIRNMFLVHAYIEVGISLDSSARIFLREKGARIIKIYLGNIMNIDIESIHYMKDCFFNHHIVGEIDEIWMSPHYTQNLEYGTVLNKVPIEKGRIAPYVWDPCFVELGGKYWKSVTNCMKTDIVIMEPNISFQKSFLFPLLLAESFSKRWPEWKGRVCIINGNRLQYIPYVINAVFPQLNLYKDKRIDFCERKTMHQIMSEHGSSVFITHQLNNDFNYMILELLHMDYPVLHNSIGWASVGYSYDINKWDMALEQLYKSIRYHKDNLEQYRVHACGIAWKHSIYNPEIQEQWGTLLC